MILKTEDKEKTRKERYEDYLTSDHWKNLRERKLILSGRKCRRCNVRSNLHVHHVVYRDLTDCTVDDLIVFCEPCHALLHKALQFYRMTPEGFPEEKAVSLIDNFSGTFEGKQWSERRKLKHSAGKTKPKLRIDHTQKKRLRKMCSAFCSGFFVYNAKELHAELGYLIAEFGR